MPWRCSRLAPCRIDGAPCSTSATSSRPSSAWTTTKGGGAMYPPPAGGSGWVAYQHRIQSGLLEHKVTTVEKSDGTAKMVEQVLVTPKGLARLAQVFSSAKEDA